MKGLPGAGREAAQAHLELSGSTSSNHRTSRHGAEPRVHLCAQERPGLAQPCPVHWGRSLVLDGTTRRGGSRVRSFLPGCPQGSGGPPEKPHSSWQASTLARWPSVGPWQAARPPSLLEPSPAPLTRSPAQEACSPAWGPAALPHSTRPCCRSPAALARPHLPIHSAPAPGSAVPPRARSPRPAKGTFRPRPASPTPRAKPRGESSLPSQLAAVVPSSHLPANPALCPRVPAGTAARATGRTVASGAGGSGRRPGPPA